MKKLRVIGGSRELAKMEKCVLATRLVANEALACQNALASTKTPLSGVAIIPYRYATVIFAYRQVIFAVGELWQTFCHCVQLAIRNARHCEPL